VTVIVAAGDTLSSIAASQLGSAAQWPALWWANHVAVPDPDRIIAGQPLAMPDAGPVGAGLTARAMAAIPQPVAVTVSYARPAAAHTTHYAAAASPAARFSGTGGFQSCVISHESGGDAQVMNGSGHYGLYQFSFSTWTGHGGAASEFGHASVAEQNQVFENTVAADGDSDWRPYDGCSL
jgi:hypothetical protein